jgi:predicted TIM-barrel fold metal-dependent hydrolase
VKKKSEEPFIIDAHIHLGFMANFYMPDNSLDRMIRSMDRCAIKAVLASHIAGLMTHQFEYAHGETVKAIRSHPGRIYGYAIYDPHFPESSLDEVKRHLAMSGFIGVKIHPAGHAYPIDGGGYEPLWKLAAENAVPVLTHTWDATPQSTYPYELVPAQVNAQPMLVGRVAQRYPDVKIIMAHSGGHYNGHLQAIEAARSHENVYVDIAGETIGFGLIEWFVREIGADRILYGSDLNWIDPRAHLGRVLGADITPSEKENILYRNAHRIFTLTP